MGINIAQQTQYITQAARQYGLDPRAVLAIASHEGLSGGIGDNGTSFGPFQLHKGGALPSAHYGNAQQWAWSNEGINYALQQMARSGARGLTGRAAVSAISRNFERPANPAGEIADAMAHYGKVGGFLSSAPTDFAKGKGQITQAGGKTQRFDSALFHRQAGMLMLQSAVAEANGGIDPQTGQAPPDLLTSLAAARHAATQTVSLAHVGDGKFAPAVAGGGGSSLGARAVAMAKRQLGVPYVWGGETPGKAFDCSGLVQWAYGAVGVKMPRVAVDQGRMGHAVSYGALQPGDLLVENNGDHIVMYAGNGKVIQAPHTGQRVQMSPLSWFPSSQYKARRIR